MMFTPIPLFPCKKERDRLLEQASVIAKIRETQKRISILLYKVEIDDEKRENFENIKAGFDEIKNILLKMNINE
ncbi:MAG: hypothetical protein NC112_02640 [Oxalobacter formigenes]|nr:hypothetical protein [Oxalobacter formigenes]